MKTKEYSMLIVEDDEFLCENLKKYLGPHGFMADCVTGLVDAATALDNKAYDILVSDIHLKDGSGLDLMKMIKEAKIHIYAIAISGIAHESECLKAGFNFLLEKPFKVSQLVEKLNSARLILDNLQ